MKYYIAIHSHKYGNTPYLFKSNTLNIRIEGTDNYQKNTIIIYLEIDFDADRDILEVFEAEGYKDIKNIKF